MPPIDVTAFAGAAAILVGTLLVASLIPAHAARIDPLAVLKEE